MVQGEADQNTALITSDGKNISRSPWGGLPTVEDFEEEEEEESSEDEMEESSSEEEEEEEEEETKIDKPEAGTVPAGFPPALDGMETPAVLDLRKSSGEETPMVTGGPKQLYAVLEETSANKANQQGAVFTSEVAYVVPGKAQLDGIESVLSKVPNKEESSKRKRDIEDKDSEVDLEKKFKF